MRGQTKLTVCALITAATVVTPARAMEWTATDRGLSTVIEAVGGIESGDAEKLVEIVKTVNQNVRQLVQREEAFDFRPVVSFNSPGGNLFAGLQIGLVINELGLSTLVAEDSGCFSACTYAVLGGKERRVLGPFGVHAMSASSGTVEPGMLDDVQEVSAILVAYVRDLVGVSDMAEAGLKVSAADIRELTDDELRDWNIITHVSRPSQQFDRPDGPLSRCGDADWRQEIIPHDVICTDLTVARNYLEIGETIADVREYIDAAKLAEEQARFEAYWQSCDTAWMAQLNAPQQIRPRVEECVRNAFTARADELEALKNFHQISNSQPAKNGWKQVGN